MKIGILGSGDVAQSLGRGIARHGHDVMLGTRDASKLAEWKAETKAKVGSFADAARHGEVVILALNGRGASAALDMAGVASFAGKLVLDATNPLEHSDEGVSLFVGTTDSLGERIQRQLTDAKVVKCFNTVSHIQMVDPTFKEGTPPMLIAGNDGDAKKRAEAFLRELGWPGVIDTGDIRQARWLEALVPLWVAVALARGQEWSHAFKSVV
ncbi:MAG TPA: NAD(P)-binding domain-containing protein [Candidatus Thermoplasmatota archaeon]|nr:NAD(P)-binding domain-containing protein [Candidatus Thermoplasmatota archaeon]